LASAPRKPSASWFDPGRLAEVNDAIEVLGKRCTSVSTALADVARLFSPEILDIEADALHLRFTQVHRGFGKLRPAYWRDRRTLRRFAKSGRIREEEINGLATVADCRRRRQDLASAEARHAAALEGEYRSLDTDFADLRERAGVAQAVVRLVGSHV